MSSEEKEERRISRRKFVKGAAAASVGVGVLASCGPTPAPQIIKETVEVPVEVEKIVKETVEVPVEVAKMVEKEVAGPPVEAAYEILSPIGMPTVEMITMAPRLDTLEGKTICMLTMSDLAFRSGVTMPVIEQLLKEKYPTATVVPYTEMPWSLVVPAPGTTTPELETLQAALIEKGCDAVISGNGG